VSSLKGGGGGKVERSKGRNGKWEGSLRRGDVMANNYYFALEVTTSLIRRNDSSPRYLFVSVVVFHSLLHPRQAKVMITSIKLAIHRVTCPVAQAKFRDIERKNLVIEALLIGIYTRGKSSERKHHHDLPPTSPH